MSLNKRKIYIIGMILILLLLCSILGYKLMAATEVCHKLETENTSLKKENKDLKSESFDPLHHVLPEEDYDINVKDDKTALLALLLHNSLKHYSDTHELQQIDLEDYIVSNRDKGYVFFANPKEDIEFFVEESDNHEYYHLMVKSISALKNGGSGTLARYYVYKDGYVVSAY